MRFTTKQGNFPKSQLEFLGLLAIGVIQHGVEVPDHELSQDRPKPGQYLLEKSESQWVCHVGIEEKNSWSDAFLFALSKIPCDVDEENLHFVFQAPESEGDGGILGWIYYPPEE